MADQAKSAPRNAFMPKGEHSTVGAPGTESKEPPKLDYTHSPAPDHITQGEGPFQYTLQLGGQPDRNYGPFGKLADEVEKAQPRPWAPVRDEENSVMGPPGMDHQGKDH